MITARQLNTNIEQARGHVLFHHHDADGYITVAQRQKDGHFKQYHYRIDELTVKLSEWLGEDVYFSQNTFFIPFRRIENIRQLRSLYIDIDFYNVDWLKGLQPFQVLELLKMDEFNKSIPEPNIVIFSGNGIVLIWLLEPVPSQALPLWNAVQRYLHRQLQSYGADSKALDATRVFRVAGTINSKNGATVSAEFLKKERYSLREIQRDYLQELNDADKPKKKKGRPSKIVQLFNIHRLYYARLMDLIKLLELRNYDVVGYREIILFLYRYWSCCYTGDTEKALQDALDINAMFTVPLSENEVIRATRSAEKMYYKTMDEKEREEAKKRGYPDAGYNYSNKKLIELLDITEEEQRHLSTIIGANEKRRRTRERVREHMREKRGTKGTREEYNAQRRADKERTKELLKRLLEKQPNATNKELAEFLGLSVRQIQNLKRELREGK
jgi:hypothetical protein